MIVPIYRSAAAVTEERLAALEQRLGLQLPKDYRAFLLRHNGGMAFYNTFSFRDKDGRSREAWLGWIYSVGTEGKVDPEDLDLETAYAQRPSGLPAGLLPIAYAWFAGNDGTICISAGTGADRAKVFLRPNIDPARPTVFPVAVTFSAFLKGLTGPREIPLWEELIQDGDAAGLNRWLQENKKKWKASPTTPDGIMSAAVSEARWDVIEVLLNNGFSAGEMFEDAIRGRRPHVALRLLERGEIPIATIQETLTKTWSRTFWNNQTLLRSLLSAGADVHNVDSGGRTSLHFAAIAGSLDAVRFLLEHGANPTAADDDKETPSQAARRNEHDEVARFLDEAAANWRTPVTIRSREVIEPELHGVGFRKSGPKLTLERLGEVEDALGQEFPPEYRGLLLRHNGGVPKPAKFRLGIWKGSATDSGKDEEEFSDPLEDNPELTEKLRSMALRQQELIVAGRMDEAEELTSEMNALFSKIESQRGGADDIAEIEWFYPVGPSEGKKWPHESLQEVIQGRWEGDGTPRRMLPIASVEGPMEGGTLHVSCQGKDRGHIYFRPGCLEGHEETVIPMAESLSALFARMAERAKRKKSPRDSAERAIRDGDADALERLLVSGMKPNKRNRQGATLLDLAVEKGEDECVLLLIAHGVSIDEAFESALYTGAARLIRRLLDLHPGPSPADVKAALLTWNIFTDPDLVRDLIARGANPKARGQDGTTPLHAATTAMNLESVRILLEAGADPNSQDKQGQTPLQAAALRSHPGGLAVIRLLFERGARAGIWDHQGQLALHYAARNGDLELARLLIDAGEDLHAKHPRQPAGGSERQTGQLAESMARVLMDLQKMFKDHSDPDLASRPIQQAQQKSVESLAGSPQGAILEQFLNMTPEKMQVSTQLFTQQGLSAAEFAGFSPQGRAILPELESYYRKKHSSDAERGE